MADENPEIVNEISFISAVDKSKADLLSLKFKMYDYKYVEVRFNLDLKDGQVLGNLDHDGENGLGYFLSKEKSDSEWTIFDYFG